MRQTTKIGLAWELSGQKTPKTRIAEHTGVSRRTIHRWITGIEKAGDLKLFLDIYLTAKKGPRKKRKIDGLLKKIIYKIRDGNKECCGQKIKYYL